MHEYSSDIELKSFLRESELFIRTLFHTLSSQRKHFILLRWVQLIEFWVKVIFFSCIFFPALFMILSLMAIDKIALEFGYIEAFGEGVNSTLILVVFLSSLTMVAIFFLISFLLMEIRLFNESSRTWEGKLHFAFSEKHKQEISRIIQYLIPANWEWHVLPPEWAFMLATKISTRIGLVGITMCSRRKDHWGLLREIFIFISINDEKIEVGPLNLMEPGWESLLSEEILQQAKLKSWNISEETIEAKMLAMFTRLGDNKMNTK